MLTMISHQSAYQIWIVRGQRIRLGKCSLFCCSRVGYKCLDSNKTNIKELILLSDKYTCFELRHRSCNKNILIISCLLLLQHRWVSIRIRTRIWDRETPNNIYYDTYLHKFWSSMNLFLFEPWCPHKAGDIDCFPMFYAHTINHSAKFKHHQLYPCI